MRDQLRLGVGDVWEPLLQCRSDLPMKRSSRRARYVIIGLVAQEHVLERITIALGQKDRGVQQGIHCFIDRRGLLLRHGQQQLAREPASDD